MSAKPVFMATHPRACSTAFERVFMTRRNDLQTIHEPFGDAFYFGPERMGSRYENDEKAREESGFADSTYASILETIDREAEDGKRIFIKDIIHYLLPPGEQPASIAPSLNKIKRGVGTNGLDLHPASARDSGVIVPDESSKKSAPFPYANGVVEPGNPTVVPRELLKQFHFTFLIRHPRSSIPSYYRCCLPPLVERTKFDEFMSTEAGYSELRRFFDFCMNSGLVGPKLCGRDKPASISAAEDSGIEICVIDADDLLDDPEGVMRQYCKSIGLDFSPEMLKWESEESHEFARKQFSKWDGFHDDAINSRDLKPRVHKHKPKSDEEMYADWIEKYGQEAADMIKKTVDENVEHYNYLKQFAIRI